MYLYGVFMCGKMYLCMQNKCVKMYLNGIFYVRKYEYAKMFFVVLILLG